MRQQMKNQTIFYATLIVSMVIFFVGCSTLNVQLTAETTKIPNASTTFDQTSATAVLTNEPSILQSGNTPLPLEIAQARFLGLLATNEECILPCFWGLTPGESTADNATEIFSSLTSISHYSTEFTQGFSAISIEDGEYTLNTLVDYESYDNNSSTINVLIVSISESHNLAPTFGHSFFGKQFGDLVEPYTLPAVLTDLGRPASVLISTSSTDITRFWQYKILVIYPAVGVVVQYTTQLQPSGESIIGCPSDAHIDIQLFPAGDVDQFVDLLSKTIWAGFWPPSETPQPGWLPIDQATDMTIDEFNELFLNNPDACISTPAELWD